MKDIRLSRKKVILSVLLLVVVALAGVVGWQLKPASADEMKRCMLVVERTSWQAICADGRPILFFDSLSTDNKPHGVTAYRDSALHRHHMAGCWINTLPLLPSCKGRVACVDVTPKKHGRITADSLLVFCQRSVKDQLRTLQQQHDELAYYLRVHGVQDNGYQHIAGMAQ